jgi:hypothetical protein
VPYSTTTYRLLISAPRDVPESDISVVEKATNRWSIVYGPQFGAAVVPMHWRQHSAAEHGSRPQASLNKQLVEQADILLALFWHRLGSPTGEAESGTVEEIEEAHAGGAYVAILRCRRDVPDTADLSQQAKLREFYKANEPRSLMLDYNGEGDLARHVDSILSRAVGRDTGHAEAAVSATRPPAEVWPRVESSDDIKTDSRGNVRTSRRWRLILSNTGEEPARNVHYRFEAENEDDQLPPTLDEMNQPVEVLAPGGEVGYPLILHMGVAPQARCIVTWEDATGEHENRATIRFY